MAAVMGEPKATWLEPPSDSMEPPKAVLLGLASLVPPSARSAPWLERQLAR